MVCCGWLPGAGSVFDDYCPVVALIAWVAACAGVAVGAICSWALAAAAAVALAPGAGGRGVVNALVPATAPTASATLSRRRRRAPFGCVFIPAKRSPATGVSRRAAELTSGPASTPARCGGRKCVEPSWRPTACCGILAVGRHQVCLGTLLRRASGTSPLCGEGVLGVLVALRVED